MNEKISNDLSPIEKAKQFIEKASQEKRSMEEIAQREEELRLEGFFSEVKDLYDKIPKIDAEKDAHLKEKGNSEIEKHNIAHAEKEAALSLKSHPDTKQDFFDAGHNNIEEFHKERREKFTAVFGDAQEKKRKAKKTMKKEGDAYLDARRSESEVRAKIEELKKSSDWQKIVEKKKNEFIAANREYDGFYKGDKSERVSLYNALTKVNKFSETYKGNIQELKSVLTKDLDELVQKERNVFKNAEKSNEYVPEEFGKINFEKYLSLLPESGNELPFSLYSSDDSRFAFPTLDYNSTLHKELSKEIDETYEAVNLAEEQIRHRTGIFSGRGKYEKQAKVLEKKMTFLKKIRESIDNHIQEFNKKEIPPLVFDAHQYPPENSNDKKYARTVGRYIGAIGSGVYPLEKSNQNFPEFRKTINYQDLFGMAKQNDIPVEWQQAAEMNEELRNRVANSRKEYELLAGSGAASNVRI